MTSVKYLLAAIILLSQLVDEICCDDNLFDKYNRLLSVYTGYPKEIPNFDIVNLTSADVKILKIKVYHQLMCNYLYSGLLYVWLTRSILEKGEEFEKVNETTDLHFFKQASAMITFMHLGGQRSAMDPIWWNYMYAMYFEKMVNGEIEYDKKTVSSFCSKVEMALNEIVCNHVCDQNNYFNNKLNTYKKQIRLKAGSESMTKNRFSFIASLTKTVSQDLDRYAELMSYNTDQASKTHTGLAIPQTVMLTFIMKNFGEFADSDLTLSLMEEYYNNTADSEDIEERFIGLGKYNSELISILKIIMLQIIKNHYQYIIDCLLFSDNMFFIDSGVSLCLSNTLSNVIRKMSTRFARFLKLFNISLDDSEIEGAKYLFGNSTTTDITLPNVVAAIDINLMTLSNKLNSCKIIYYKQVDEEYVKKLLRKIEKVAEHLKIKVDDEISSEILPFKETLMRATVFVDYLEIFYKNDSFDIVQSLIRFSNKLEEKKIRSENEVGEIDET